MSPYVLSIKKPHQRQVAQKIRWSVKRSENNLATVACCWNCRCYFGRLFIYRFFTYYCHYSEQIKKVRSAALHFSVMAVSSDGWRHLHNYRISWVVAIQLHSGDGGWTGNLDAQDKQKNIHQKNISHQQHCSKLKSNLTNSNNLHYAPGDFNAKQTII